MSSFKEGASTSRLYLGAISADKVGDEVSGCCLRKKHLSCRPKGSSLIQVMIALGLFSIVSVIFVQWMDQQNKQIAALRISISKDILRVQLANYARNSAVINFSTAYRGPDSDGNLSLDYCNDGATSPTPATPPAFCTGADCCVQNDVSTPRYFKMMDPTVPAGTVMFAGTDTNPARYDTYGNSCNPATTVASLACPFEVVSSFVAVCPGGAAKCPRASGVSIRFEISIPLTLNIGSPFRKISSAPIMLDDSSSSSKGFSSFKVYDYAPGNGSYTWTVPDGTSKIMVEAWGAGGSGSWTAVFGSYGQNGGSSGVTGGPIAGGGRANLGSNSGGACTNSEFCVKGEDGHASGGGLGAGTPYGGAGGDAGTDSFGTIVGGGAKGGGESSTGAHFGGGGGSPPLGGPGGGGGAYAKGTMDVTPGGTINIVVGKGGDGFNYSGVIGGAGGNGRVVIWW